MNTRYRAALPAALLIAFLVALHSGCGTPPGPVTDTTAVQGTGKEAPPASPQPQAGKPAAAGGVFLGKSGTPMAGARLILCSMREDPDSLYGVAKLLDEVPIATTDAAGRFEFSGLAPGRYTIAYLPAGVKTAVPNEITVSPLNAVDKSITPLLRNTELGTGSPYQARPWGQFTLMKGHTFWSMGPEMRIWNATARFGRQGPYFEIRRGNLWMQQMAPGTETKFDAWSF